MNGKIAKALRGKTGSPKAFERAAITERDRLQIELVACHKAWKTQCTVSAELLRALQGCSHDPPRYIVK